MAQHMKIEDVMDVDLEAHRQYMLNRDQTESARLEQQHMLYTKSLGYLIKPEIQKYLDTVEQPRIADVGTGTMVWILAAAKSFDGRGTFHATDISEAQLPDRDTFPPNVSFRYQNAKDPVPDDMVGVYDLVHVRLMLYALDPDEWIVVVNHLKKMLKKTGFLQWEEVDLSPTMFPLRNFETSRTSHLEQGFRQLFEMSRHRCEYVHDYLYKAMTANEMDEVKRDVVASDRYPEHRRLATEMEPILLVGVWKSRYGENSPEVKRAKALAEKIRDDADSGGYINFYMHSVSCKRPRYLEL